MGTSALGTRRRCRAWGKRSEDVLGSSEVEVLRNQRSHAVAGHARFAALGLRRQRGAVGIFFVGVAELSAAGD